MKKALKTIDEALILASHIGVVVGLVIKVRWLSAWILFHIAFCCPMSNVWQMLFSIIVLYNLLGEIRQFLIFLENVWPLFFIYWFFLFSESFISCWSSTCWCKGLKGNFLLLPVSNVCSSRLRSMPGAYITVLNLTFSQTSLMWQTLLSKFDI